MAAGRSRPLPRRVRRPLPRARLLARPRAARRARRALRRVRRPGRAARRRAGHHLRRGRRRAPTGSRATSTTSACARWTGSSCSCPTTRRSPTSTSPCRSSARYPIMALPQHRYRELEQFARLSDAVACVVPGRVEGRRLPRDRRPGPGLRVRRCGWRVIDGAGHTAGFLSLADLLDREPTATTADLDAIAHRPRRPRRLPALGRHHRHPEADPAHPQRLRLQLPLRAVGVRRPGRRLPCSTCCRSRTTCPWRARACRASGSRAPAWCCTRAPAARRCSR